MEPQAIAGEGDGIILSSGRLGKQPQQETKKGDGIIQHDPPYTTILKSNFVSEADTDVKKSCTRGML
jgi:hypothetical protein